MKKITIAIIFVIVVFVVTTPIMALAQIESIDNKKTFEEICDRKTSNEKYGINDILCEIIPVLNDNITKLQESIANTVAEIGIVKEQMEIMQSMNSTAHQSLIGKIQDNDAKVDYMHKLHVEHVTASNAETVNLVCSNSQFPVDVNYNTLSDLVVSQSNIGVNSDGEPTYYNIVFKQLDSTPFYYIEFLCRG